MAKALIVKYITFLKNEILKEGKEQVIPASMVKHARGE